MKIKINDFSISIKLSTIIIFLLMIALGYIEQFFILYMFIVIHEIIHILASYCFGGKCSGIVIIPVGLYAKIDGIENMRLYKKNIVIVLAPLFNIIVGLIFNNRYIGIANLCIGLFNLMPVYPLDGALFFQNTVGYILGTLKANKYLAILSRIFMLLLFFIGILWLVLFDFNFFILIISIYLYKESKKLNLIKAVYFYKCLMKNKNMNLNKIKFKKFCEKTTLKELMYVLGMDYYTIIYVRGRIIDEDKIKAYILEYGLSASVGDILNNFSL